MSTPEPTSAPAAPPPLGLLDALLCQHDHRAVAVPPWVAPRLRALDLWLQADPPERAYHLCGKSGTCIVLLLTRRDDAANDGVAVDLADWRLAADREGDATRKIVVVDCTRRRRP